MVEVIRWTVELGRVDILLDTALMYTYLALPHRGHIKQAFQIFGYLKVNPKRNFALIGFMTTGFMTL